MTQDIYLSAKGKKYQTRNLAERNIPAGYEIVEDPDGFYGLKRDSQEVICPLCGACHYETTDQHDPDKHAHPGMLRLKEPYAEHGWEPPPPDPSAGSGSIECMDCGGLIAPEGKFKLR